MSLVVRVEIDAESDGFRVSVADLERDPVMYAYAVVPPTVTPQQVGAEIGRLLAILAAHPRPEAAPPG